MPTDMPAVRLSGRPARPGIHATEAQTRAARASGRSNKIASTPTAGSTQRIVASITEAIVGRRLMPGTKLSAQKIADIFKVSHPWPGMC